MQQVYPGGMTEDYLSHVKPRNTSDLNFLHHPPSSQDVANTAMKQP